MSIWTVPTGLDSLSKVTICGPDGKAIVFTGAESLAVQCWQGDDQNAVTNLVTASWTGGDPPNGVAVLTASGSSSAGLTPALYRLRLLVTIGTRTLNAWEGWLLLGDSPGSGTPPPTYCSLQDMLDFAGDWLFALVNTSGRTGFLAERQRAREWIDAAILHRIRNGSGTWDLTGPYLPWAAPEAENTAIVAYLAANNLIVDGDVREATASKAIGFVCDRAIADGPNDPWPARAARFHARARSVLLCSVAGIDTNADGLPDISVNFAFSSFR